MNGKTETILVDSAGLPLYYYPADTAKKSWSAGSWTGSGHPCSPRTPPLRVPGQAHRLKVAAGHQVTYKGHFLYTFIEDYGGTGHRPRRLELLRGHTQLKKISSAVKVASTAPASLIGCRLWLWILIRSRRLGHVRKSRRGATVPAPESEGRDGADIVNGTVPGKGWFTLLWLDGPLEPWFDQSWRPAEFELLA